MNGNIGKQMQEGKSKAISGVITTAGIIVYIAAVFYAEAHNYTLMVQGIQPDMLPWAIVGIVSLGITALMLPLGLHSAFYDARQNLGAWLFYGLDLVLLIANAVIDYIANRQGALPGWGRFYLDYVVPMNPILVGLGWSLLLLADPKTRMRAAVETLAASTQTILIDRLEEAAKAEEISQAVDERAIQMARAIIDDTLSGMGVYSARQLPLVSKTTLDGKRTLEGRPEDKKRTRWSIPGLSKFHRPKQAAASAPETSNGNPTTQRKDRPTS